MKTDRAGVPTVSRVSEIEREIYVHIYKLAINRNRSMLIFSILCVLRAAHSGAGDTRCPQEGRRELPLCACGRWRTLLVSSDEIE